MKKIFLLAVSAIALTGCSSFGFIEDTGAGRAWNRAWQGTPEEVVDAVKFVDDKMERELRGKYEAIESAPVTNRDGTVNRKAAENRFRDMALTYREMQRWEELSEALATYLGVDLDKPASADERRADKARSEFWDSLKKGAKKAADDIKDEVKDGEDE